MPFFVCTHSETGNAWSIDVHEDPVRLGRSREAHVCLPDVSVSKNHVNIERRGGGRFYFRDLGSRNGTFLNDIKLEQGPLEDGDELRVGKYLITFYREKSAAPTARMTKSSRPGGGRPRPGAEKRISGPRFSRTTKRIRKGVGRSGAEPGEAVEEDRPAEGEAPLTEDTVDVVFDLAPDPAEKNEEMAVLPPLKLPDGPGAPDVLAGGGDPFPVTDPSALRGDAHRGGAERAHREAPRGRFRALFLVGCIACLALGFGLGKLGSCARDSVVRNGEPAPSVRHLERELEQVPVHLSDAERGAVAESKAATESRSVEPEEGEGDDDDEANGAMPMGLVAAEEDVVPLVLGPRADLRDPEVSRRALYRLSLDLLERTPTRAEVHRLLPLPHEERWKELLRMAGAPNLSSFSEVLERFLGRPGRPDEERRLREKVSGIPEHLGRILTASELYSSARHRRLRDPRKRARALWVDVLDRLPTQRNIDLALPALRKPEDAEKTVRLLVYSDHSMVGPLALGQEPDEWVREVYARFLLRYPKDTEVETAIAEMEREADGWRFVVLNLGLHSDYLSY